MLLFNSNEQGPFLTNPTPSSGDMGKAERAAHISLISQETGERANSSKSRARVGRWGFMGIRTTGKMLLYCDYKQNH